MRRITSCARALPFVFLSLTLTAHSLPAMQESPPVPAPTVTIPIPGTPNPMPDRLSDPLVSEPTTQDGEAQLRGPVHEAFAEQFNQDPVEGVVIPQKPPELIEEVPPEVRPDGRQIEWISGYWSWDDEEADFLWVSGIWREVPQGFRWLPGYWTEVENGYQWVSGTWVSAQTEEIQYLETAPPLSLELGPVGAAPSVEHIWIPGCWNWVETHYAWRPGYWSVGQSNWIWVPAHYVCTPRGYLYSDGYWDYPFERRGLLFAPCRFQGMSQWDRPYRFTPRVIVAVDLLPLHFWVRPNFCHYYFGDFYGDDYASRGFQPWHHFHRQRRQFDPLFAHFSHTHSSGHRDYYDRVDRQFDLLSRHPDRRPFRDFSGDNRRVAANLADHDERPALLGTTLQDHMKESGSSHFVKLDQGVRQRFQDDTRELQTLIHHRRDVERPIRRNSDTPRGRDDDQAASEPGHVRRDALKNGPLELPKLTDDTNRPIAADGNKAQDSQSVTRPDRLKLPTARRSRESGKPPAEANSTAGAPDQQSPGTPISRGERPRNVDEILNRARKSARNAKESKENESPVAHERGGRSLGQTTQQELPNAAKVKGDRLNERAKESRTEGAAARSGLPSQLQRAASDQKTLNNGAGSRRIQPEVKDRTVRTREKAETGLPGGVGSREGGVRPGQRSIPAQESHNKGSVLSGGIGGRPNGSSARVNPPQQPSHAQQAPPTERPSRGAVENRRDIRVDTPRSNGPAERSRQADTPRSSPEPRERGHRDSEGSGRRKK